MSLGQIVKKSLDRKSLANVDTLYSADAVEFSPHNPFLFACGTYQIEETVNPSITGEVSEATRDIKRYGRCYLYEIDQDGTNIKERQQFDGPAILDLKWSHSIRSNSDIDSVLAIANAQGQVQLHGTRLTTESNNIVSNLIHTIHCADPEVLCLSLDWSDRRLGVSTPETSNPSIVVSLSNGSICVLAGEHELKVTSKWHGHDFEPWIAAFDCWNPQSVWTGGDDLKLKVWDLRQGCDQPTFTNKRSFEGGVTAIQSHPLIENLFAVGSYDSKVRIFDRRKPLVPLTEYDAGGGVWRVKWHPTRSDRLAVAAMHCGASVVQFEGLTSSDPGVSPSFTGIAGSAQSEFKEHKSMAYGIDWSGAQDSKGDDILASCSFYDHQLHVWTC